MKRIDPKHSFNYFLFGIKVTVSSSEKRFHDRLGAFLNRCPNGEARPSPEAQVSFDLYSAEDSLRKPSIPRSASLVSSPEFPLKIYKAGQEFYLTFEESWLQLSLPECRSIGVFDEKIWKYPRVAESFFFNGLCMMFHFCGLYPIHAAGLTFQKQGFLFIGKSGSGKSTLALTLVKRGWKYLSDDILLLRLIDSTAEMLAIPVEFKTDNRTMHRFLASAGSDFVFQVPIPEAMPYDDKHYVRMDRFYPDRFESRCLPRFLLFAEVAPRATSELAILGKNETLRGLLEASQIFMFDAGQAAGHLEALKTLVQQTTAYRLYAGRDVLESPESFEKFLLDNTQTESKKFNRDV